jgi:hypothetical protein
MLLRGDACAMDEMLGQRGVFVRCVYRTVSMEEASAIGVCSRICARIVHIHVRFCLFGAANVNANFIG